MTRIKADPRRQRFPSLSGKLILYDDRGQLVARSWPRKRGRPKSKWVRVQNAWFKEAGRLVKHAPASQQLLAMNATRNLGLLWRDVLTRTISEGIFDFTLPDGRLIQHRRPFLENVVFQGAILKLTSPFSLPAGVRTTIEWPLPVLDTFGFWDPAQPTRLTIPPGPDVVSLSAGWVSTLDLGTNLTNLLIRKNGLEVSRQAQTETGFPGCGVGYGALDVVAGDFFDVAIFTSKATAAQVNERTFFTLNVLGAG